MRRSSRLTTSTTSSSSPQRWIDSPETSKDGFTCSWSARREGARSRAALFCPREAVADILSDGPSAMLGAVAEKLEPMLQYAANQDLLPSLYPVVVSSKGNAGAMKAARDAVQRGAEWIIGCVASRWQGDPRITLPTAVLQELQATRFASGVYEHMNTNNGCGCSADSQLCGHTSPHLPMPWTPSQRCSSRGLLLHSPRVLHCSGAWMPV